MSTKTKRGQSRFIGCYPSKNRKSSPWRAQARLPGVEGSPFFIGQFTTELEAAVAHDQVMVVTHSHLVRHVNFTDEVRAYLELELRRSPFTTVIHGVPDLEPPKEGMAPAARNTTAYLIRERERRR